MLANDRTGEKTDDQGTTKKQFEQAASSSHNNGGFIFELHAIGTHVANKAPEEAMHKDDTVASVKQGTGWVLNCDKTNTQAVWFADDKHPLTQTRTSTHTHTYLQKQSDTHTYTHTNSPTQTKTHPH